MATLLGNLALTALSTEAAISVANVAGTISAETSTFDINNTATVSTSTGLAEQRFARFRAPVLSVANLVTVTRASTVTIDGPPSNPGAGTITEALAFHVMDGNCFIRDYVKIGNHTPGFGAFLHVISNHPSIGFSVEHSSIFDSTAAEITNSSGTRILTLSSSGSFTTSGAEESLVTVGLGAALTFDVSATNQRYINIGTPTAMVINAGITVTNAATLYIGGAPNKTGAGTLTNAYALWVDDGIARFDGAIRANGNIGININPSITGLSISHSTSGGNAVFISNTSDTGSFQVLNSTSGATTAFLLQQNSAGLALSTDNNGAGGITAAIANGGTTVISAGVTDGFHAAMRCSPSYSAATAQTVTRHNYIDLENVVAGGAGPATITDACVMRFNAAAGTHKAVDAGTTKASPGTVDAWVKVNINGTIYYQPSYTSKTT